MDGHLGDLTLTVEQRPRRPEGGGHGQLAVFDGGTSTLFALPAVGEVVIGRAPEAHVRITDASASRQHAKILIAGDEARILDLGSHNGTRVNGEEVTAPRPLVSGDVVTIAPQAVLVFQRAAVDEPPRRILSTAELCGRLREEVARALRYRCPLSVLVFDLQGADRRACLEALAGQTRLIDLAGWTGEHALALALPEVDGPEAEGVAKRLSAALAEVAPGVRAGLAALPTDGVTADDLLSTAREATTYAEAAGVASSASVRSTRRIGEQRVVVADPAMVRLYALLERLAASDVPVLVGGETGAGKEMAAAAIHFWSPKRKAKPFVIVNSAALPETLVESELFGYEKGAFSGAEGAKVGLIEAASGGTLFLDEIGELPLPTQAKLLRVLETQRLTRLGDVKERPIDVRLVAATNRDLEEEVKARRFRQDLLFRIGTARVTLPPLRQRRRELVPLARSLLADAAERSGRPVPRLSSETIKVLSAYEWPGNVRELKNALDFALATLDGDAIEPWHLPEALSPSPAVATPSEPADASTRFRPIEDELRELERRRMEEALEATGGVQTKAAALISMPLRTFVTKMKQFNLSSRDFKR